MLASTKLLHHRRKTTMPHRERVEATKRSMAMIKVVLRERSVQKAERDHQLRHELSRERALEQLDLRGATVWPPFIPNADRLLPLAQNITFTVALPTTDGELPVVHPDATNLDITLTIDGQPMPEKHVHKHIILRPRSVKRPEVGYTCNVTLDGQAVERGRFLESATKLRPDGAPVLATLAATLYGEPVGGGAVPVLLMPSKRLKQRVAMARINEEMRSELAASREAAAKEAGIELPPLSRSPPPTPFWSGSLHKPLLGAPPPPPATPPPPTEQQGAAEGGG